MTGKPKDRRGFIKRFSLASLLAGSGLATQSCAERETVPSLPEAHTKNNLHMGASALRGLIYPREHRSRRVSSYDRTGKNADFLELAAGATATLASIRGAGCISHIWMTIKSFEKDYLRRLILRAYWNEETTPSIEAPIGDFFGVGHARVQPFQSLPLNMVTGGDPQKKDWAAMNCFFPMPFAGGARFTLTNEGEQPVPSLYYYIDYEEYAGAIGEALQFHAQWRRQNPTRGTLNLSRPEATVDETNNAANLDGVNNYVILEATGRGHYVGCNLSIDNINPIKSFDWFGEGDDMIYIDGEQTPSLVGTGTEDYFCAAWGYPSGQYSGLYHGISLAQPLEKSPFHSGKWTTYRFHIEDPITFTKSIRVSIEHGHANIQSNDYASTAYWYQTEPHGAFPALPSVQDRLPISDDDSRRQFYKTF
ncbi:MAG: glycoside hydrolase family 172 protein [Pyrinomonadaceae bacterium]